MAVILQDRGNRHDIAWLLSVDNRRENIIYAADGSRCRDFEALSRGRPFLLILHIDGRIRIREIEAARPSNDLLAYFHPHPNPN